MSEMVDLVVKALWSAQQDSARQKPLTVAEHIAYECMARAAIDAMREPTEAMLNAGMKAVGYLNCGGRTEWQAMIDEALR